jgi:hypothetical protein
MGLWCAGHMCRSHLVDNPRANDLFRACSGFEQRVLSDHFDEATSRARVPGGASVRYPTFDDHRRLEASRRCRNDSSCGWFSSRPARYSQGKCSLRREFLRQPSPQL